MVAGYTRVPDEWPYTKECQEEGAYKARIKQMESARRERKVKSSAKAQPKRMPKKDS